MLFAQTQPARLYLAIEKGQTLWQFSPLVIYYLKSQAGLLLAPKKDYTGNEYHTNNSLHQHLKPINHKTIPPKCRPITNPSSTSPPPSAYHLARNPNPNPTPHQPSPSLTNRKTTGYEKATLHGLARKLRQQIFLYAMQVCILEHKRRKKYQFGAILFLRRPAPGGV